MEYQYLVLEVEDRVATLTLNRPEAMNALNPAFKEELSDAVRVLEQDRDIWGVIVTANGKAFSSGTDISEFPASVEAGRQATVKAQSLYNRIENLEKPVIAAVNGYALGGGLELALCCDLRILSARAKVGFPEVKIGAIPCYGGTQRLTRLIGAGRTKELIFTGKMLTAGEALEWGIANEVTEAGRELARARELMKTILQNAPMAVAYSKLCINRGPEISLENALTLEQNLVAMLVGTHDMDEGTQAFLEKRPAVFENR